MPPASHERLRTVDRNGLVIEADRNAGASKENVMSPERLLAPTEVSELLGIPTRTLTDWRYRGEGPRYLRIGRHVRYRPAEIESWLERAEANQNGRGW